MLLAGLSSWHAGVQQIAVVGPASAPSRDALERVAAAHYLPFAVIVPVEPGERQRRIAVVAPFVAAMQAAGGRATAYVCRDFACSEPTSDPGVLTGLLAS